MPQIVYFSLRLKEERNNLSMSWKKLIGTRDFYRHLLIIVVPIIIQNAITNFVSMLDNIMVGQIGTAQMSGVSIVNQLVFVFNLCIFGAVSGAGIYTAQFYGQRNHEGVRYTFRFKLILVALVSVISLLLFRFYGDSLIRMYLEADAESAQAEAILDSANAYLKVIMAGLPAFAVMQAYSGTLRESNDTLLPMKAGIAAVLVNLVFNYILIFGKFGAPALGAVGAAAATVLSRYVELAIIVIYTHTHKKRHPFISGAFKGFYIPGRLAGQMLIKGMPLLVNETLWASAQAALLQQYAFRGLTVIAAYNISSTLSNVFNVGFISMGSAIAIIIGQELGAGKATVREDAAKLTFTAVAACVAIGAVMALAAPVFPMIYRTEAEVRALASRFILVSSCLMPLYAYNNSAYFIVRSGGRTVITFLLDSCFVWAVMVPTAYALTRFTSLGSVPILFLTQLTEGIKAVIGHQLVRRGVWIQNLT